MRTPVINKSKWEDSVSEEMHDTDRAYCRKYGCKDSEAESRNEDTDLSAEPELEKQCEDD